MNYASGTTRKAAVSHNNITEVRVATPVKAISTIAMTASGRIAMTAVVVATTINAIRNKKQEDRNPSDCGNKVFKPCSTHGPKSKHTSEECYKNPKNLNKHQTHDKKRQYEAHHNNAGYTSDNNELHISANTPVPSEDPASAFSKSKTHEDENYHLHVDKKLKAGSHVPCKSDHQQHKGKSQTSQKGKKGEMPPTFLDDDLNFMDTILMGLNSMDADLNRPDDITNPLDFNM
jgi:hypothetical protein